MCLKVNLRSFGYGAVVTTWSRIFLQKLTFPLIFRTVAAFYRS